MNNTQRVYVSADNPDSISQRPKLTIVHSTPITYIPQRDLKKVIAFTINRETLSFTIPYAGHRAAIHNAQGRTIISFNGNRARKYVVPLHLLSNGMHILYVRHDQSSESLQFPVVK